MTTSNIKTEIRPISSIARDIASEWSKAKNGINYAAKPYLSAMRSLSGIKDQYGLDDARSIVNYFLCNASGFRGGNAKNLKNELKAHLKG